jgi:hypothetical protein
MVKKRISYKGKLAKPTQEGPWLAAEMREQGKYDELRSKHEMDLLCELFDHYKIDREAANCWILLTYRLARDHVPAFSIAEARQTNFQSIARWWRKLHPKKAGRPRKWTPGDYDRILNARKIGEHLLSEKGTARITDAAALEAGYKEIILRSQEPAWPLSKLRKRARADAKRLPDARKSVRKLDDK